MFWAAGPGVFNDYPPGPDGSRQDVRVKLAEGVHLLVVSLGPLGPDARLPAYERAGFARSQIGEGMSLLGPIDRVDLPMGVGYRTTSVFGAGGRIVTDTHVDRDGWAFVVGVLSSSNHATAVEALDGVLATWQWIPART